MRIAAIAGNIAGSVAGVALIMATAAGIMPESAQAAPGYAPIDTPCVYYIEPETHREIVVETKKAGEIQIAHKGREWRNYLAPKNDIEYFNLKRKHKDASHFQVAVVKQGTKHNYEQVWWCVEI